MFWFFFDDPPHAYVLYACFCHSSTVKYQTFSPFQIESHHSGGKDSDSLQGRMARARLEDISASTESVTFQQAWELKEKRDRHQGILLLLREKQ